VVLNTNSCADRDCIAWSKCDIFSMAIGLVLSKVSRL